MDIDLRKGLETMFMLFSEYAITLCHVKLLTQRSKGVKKRKEKKQVD